MLALTGLLLIAIVYYIVADRLTPYTTDAYVQSFVVQVAPRIDGQVVEVLVEEGSAVAVGDPLFVLDPRPYEYTVARLTAALATAEATVRSLEAQRAYFNAVVTQREADVQYAQETYERNLKLREDSFAAEQALDESVDALRTNEALLTQAQADVVNIETQLEAMTGDEHSAIAQARAELNAAIFELEQTTVFSAVDGVVDNLQLREGTYLEAGDFVLTLIDTSRQWIVANFPENALSIIEPGQPVKLSFFMYPGQIFEGRVGAIGHGVYRGQGLADGLLADVDNPTAWMTLSQRFEVRIDPMIEESMALRVGATARVLVITGDHPIINGLGRFWHWLGAKFDYVY